MSTTTEAPARKKARLSLVEKLVVLGLVLLLLSCFAPELLAPIYLVIGWVPYLIRLGGRVRYDPLVVISAGLCLIALVVSLHRLCCWLYGAMATAPAGETTAAPAAGRWRLRWSVSIVGMLLFMFAAGVCVLAVVHQTYWLANSPESWYQARRSETGNKVHCASNMRQIGVAILVYAQENGGRFPGRLEDLCIDGSLSADVFICPSSEHEPAEGATTQEWVAKLSQPGHLSYVYIGQGLTSDVPADRPILYEPISNHNGDGGNLMYADGHTEFIASRPGPDGRPVFGVELPAPATAPATQEWSEQR